ncbi:hypothetical protein P4C99_06465 [Pontiellaceae bacterium B1224]|nr:hypothetical protein [Pontiellaceae bacterium B1224]
MRPSLPAALVSFSVCMVAISGIAAAQEQAQFTLSHIEPIDAHDQLVYSRYSRQVVPCNIDYETAKKHIELPQPATLEDVTAGLAVFSFEGLGERRVWKLPNGPVYSIWPELKQFPRGRNRGYIIQAEELHIGGSWKRYFGFVHKEGVAVVPAEQVYFFAYSHLDEKRVEGILPGGIIWCTSETYAPETSTADKPSRCIDIYLHNRRGTPIIANLDWFRIASDHCPALAKGITLKLKYAPFKPHTPKKNYPWNDDYSPLEPTRQNTFTPTNRLEQIETGSFRELGTLDFAEWFDITKEGHYKLDFEFDTVALGLTDEPTKVHDRVSQGFKVGTPSPRLTLTELNETIPPFGGRYTEQQLHDLIVRSVKPLLSATMHPQRQSTKSVPIEFRKLEKQLGEN